MCHGESDVDISARYVVPDGAEKLKVAVDPHAHLLRDSPVRASSRNWHPTKPNLRRVHNPASHRSIHMVKNNANCGKALDETQTQARTREALHWLAL